MADSDGGWIVIQRKIHDHVFFLKTLNAYKNGFGNLTETGSYWMGLEKIHMLTSTGAQVRLRIDIKESNSGSLPTIYYDHFKIDTEANGYALHVWGFEGGNGLDDNAMQHANGTMFRVGRDCIWFPGGWGGWWNIENCNEISWSCLNCHYPYWSSFRYLTFTEMKIKFK